MDRLGKYEIRAVLGRGAMGTVYEGWDPVIARRVAIKTVRMPDDADSEEREQLDRFQKEAQAAGRLHHPNIVGVFDYAETGGLAYIVMEFAAGRTLKAMLEGGTPPALAEVGPLMDGLLSGLEYSHANQVVHRDIKPANVIVTDAGALKIADFGIARIGSSTMTQAGTIMGTPAYMSPEQFQGGAVDSRTDIYSAGVVLFQLLTGRRPFEGGMATIMHAVLTSQAPPPSALSAGVPQAVDAVVARAMARAPESRYPTAGAFNAALQRALRASGAPRGLDGLADDDATLVAPGGRAVAPPPREAAPAARAPARAAPRRRSRLPVALAGAAGLLLAAGGGFWALREQAAKPAGPVPDDTATEAPAHPGADTLKGPAGTAAQPGGTGTPDAARPPGGGQEPDPQDSTPQGSTLQGSTLQGSTPQGGASQGGAASVPSEPAQPPEGGKLAMTEQPPPPEATLPRPAAAIRADIAEILRRTPCTAVTGEEGRSGAPVLRGAAGGDEVAAALRDALSAAAPGQALEWGVAAATGPYCAVLDLVRPLAGPYNGGGRPVGLTLKDGRTDLQEGDLMLPVVTLPDFPARLQVDYFASDGTVTHMSDALAGAAYPANGVVRTLGEPRLPEFRGWTVYNPFGTDLIVVIASAAPLFRSARPESEPQEGYLRDLRTALDAAARSRSRLSAAVIVVRTTPR